MNLKRISITGPESTGKSWLAEHLAGFFNTSWVPEYSREYLNRLGRAYRPDDILHIAMGQLERENQIAGKTRGLLFCDTDPLVTRIWSEFKFGWCDPRIRELVLVHRYDLYLLCDIDVPWQEDPLREHPGRRKELFDLYRKNLDEMNAEWVVVHGIGQERLRCAIQQVEKAFGYGHVQS